MSSPIALPVSKGEWHSNLHASWDETNQPSDLGPRDWNRSLYGLCSLLKEICTSEKKACCCMFLLPFFKTNRSSMIKTGRNPKGFVFCRIEGILIFRGEFVRFTECFMNFNSARMVFSTEKHPASVKKILSIWIYPKVTSILLTGWHCGLPSEPTQLSFQLLLFFWAVATRRYLHPNRRSDPVDRMRWRAQGGKSYWWWTDLNKQRHFFV